MKNNRSWKKLLMAMVLGVILILLELCLSYLGMHLWWKEIFSWLPQVLVVIVICLFFRFILGSGIIADETDSALTEEAKRADLRKARDERFRG